MSNLSGPTLPPANGKKAKNIVIFLHGLCSNGDDLIALGQVWSQKMKETLFISPNAIEPCSSMPFGRYQWFELTLRDESEYGRGVRKANDALEGFIQKVAKENQIGFDKIALVGFSQGTMMALHTGLRMKDQLGAIVGYSGRLVEPETLKKEVKSKPPVCLIHGQMDDVVPPSHLPIAQKALKDNGFTVETLLEPMVPHSIGQQGFMKGYEFLAKYLQA